MVEQATQLLEGVEFTHRWYRQFLQRLLGDGYDFRTFSGELGDGDVALRHDVDLRIDAAVEMAQIEADLGVTSTYCVLLTSPLYNPLEGEHRESLQKIDSLGHEVALHFSTHEYWPAESPPEEADLETRVAEERAILETVVPPTETVSFHRPPSWVLDYDFDGFQNTYGPGFFTDIDYIADSSQRWRDDPPPLEALPETMQILTHPGLWGEEDASFDKRIEMAVSHTCSHASRNARREFMNGGTN
ncbi:hypothetical protein HWV23_15880 [Natronomonas halophila]|uniref:hypothetical protein n=1 Tax=Natronomonas halophila TaxID=2747817 RepID=UPI0015B4A974|nr:hypothetical protein [Natronomonas halophila]QLD87140.1 hypothetical protein HWV23_15880 [Natronomonas halophila]